MTINQLITWIGNRMLPQVIGGAFATIVLTWCGFALWGTAAHAIESTSVDAKIDRIIEESEAKLARDNAEAKRRWANANRAFHDASVSQRRYREMLANTDPATPGTLTPRKEQLIENRRKYLENQRQIHEIRQSLLSESDLSTITRELERELEQAKRRRGQ